MNSDLLAMLIVGVAVTILAWLICGVALIWPFILGA